MFIDRLQVRTTHALSHNCLKVVFTASNCCFRMLQDVEEFSRMILSWSAARLRNVT